MAPPERLSQSGKGNLPNHLGNHSVNTYWFSSLRTY